MAGLTHWIEHDRDLVVNGFSWFDRSYHNYLKNWIVLDDWDLTRGSWILKPTIIIVANKQSMIMLYKSAWIWRSGLFLNSFSIWAFTRVRIWRSWIWHSMLEQLHNGLIRNTLQQKALKPSTTRNYTYKQCIATNIYRAGGECRCHVDNNWVLSCSHNTFYILCSITSTHRWQEHIREPSFNQINCFWETLLWTGGYRFLDMKRNVGVFK